MPEVYHDSPDLEIIEDESHAADRRFINFRVIIDTPELHAYSFTDTRDGSEVLVSARKTGRVFIDGMEV